VTSLPARSDGLLVAPLGGNVVVYDLLTETRHWLNTTASAVLAACDGVAARDDIVSGWVDSTGADTATVAAQVGAVVEQFEELGLVARPSRWEPPAPRTAADPTQDDEMAVTAPHRVLDRQIRFRSADATLLTTIDDYLGTNHVYEVDEATAGHPVPTSQLIFEVNWMPDGSVGLVTDRLDTHDQLGTLLRRLVTVTVDYASTTDGCVAIHAGALRAPSGRIVLAPGASGSGKSTLTGALIAAGWDYLGDETIGITPDGTALGFPKRLVLDPPSRDVLGVEQTPDRHVDPTDIRADVRRLGGPVGPVSQVVYPAFQHGAQSDLRPLDIYERFDALLANTLNLARVGQPGLETLCHLAETVDAFCLTHGDAHGAAALIGERITPQEPAA